MEKNDYQSDENSLDHDFLNDEEFSSLNDSDPHAKKNYFEFENLKKNKEKRSLKFFKKKSNSQHKASNLKNNDILDDIDKTHENIDGQNTNHNEDHADSRHGMEKGTNQKQITSHILKTGLDSKRNRNKSIKIQQDGSIYLLLIVCFLLTLFALPLSLIYFIKSPGPENPIMIMDFTFEELALVFFISAAIIVYASVFFLKTGKISIFLLFIISLFCCFPFIRGLKLNYSIQQVINDMAFFTSWPYYLKPAYILIQFLIPAGILVYVILQLIHFFSGKNRNYAFILSALYLTIPAIWGMNELQKASLPNLFSYIKENKEAVNNLEKNNLLNQYPNTQNINQSRDYNTIPGAILNNTLNNISKINEKQDKPLNNPNHVNNPNHESLSYDFSTQNRPEQKNQPTVGINDINLKLNQIISKLDDMISSINTDTKLNKKTSFYPDSLKLKKDDSARGNINILSKEVNRLTEKIDRISDSLQTIRSLKNKDGLNKRDKKTKFDNNMLTKNLISEFKSITSNAQNKQININSNNNVQELKDEMRSISNKLDEIIKAMRAGYQN